MPLIVFLSLALLLFGAAVLQRLILLGLGERRLIGDEKEYIQRAETDDPYGPSPFLRVPLMIWLAVRLRRHTERPERALRQLFAFAALTSVGMTAAAGWISAGPAVALVSAALLALHPERLVLACHLWPDTLLALWMSMVNLFIVAARPDNAGLAALLLGLTSALAFLTRFEYLLLWPLAALSLSSAAGPLTPSALSALALPTLLAAAACTIHNGLRYRRPLPDTTPFFNLAILGKEHELERHGPLVLEPLIDSTRRSWLAASEHQRLAFARRGLWSGVLHPGRALARFGQRLLALAGRDTFILQRVLTPRGAYPELPSGKWVQLLKASLAFYTPSLLAILTAVAAMDRALPTSLIWPAAGIAVLSFVFHVRTRYRLATMPTLSLLAGHGIVASSGTLDETRSLVLGGAVALPVLWLLMRHPRRLEEPEQSAAPDPSDLEV